MNGIVIGWDWMGTGPVTPPACGTGIGFTHTIYILYEIMMKILHEITLNVRIVNFQSIDSTYKSAQQLTTSFNIRIRTKIMYIYIFLSLTSQPLRTLRIP